MKAIAPDTKYIFPGAKKSKHICLETPRRAIQRSGIDSTIHGFRHLSSTILNESRLFKSDIIEACLAHQDKNSIRATYNKALYLRERSELFIWWNNIIDQCNTHKNNKKVIDEIFTIQ